MKWPHQVGLIPVLHLFLFGWMPSPLKILAYRIFLGYSIGRHVTIGLGSTIVGEKVEIGEYTKIDFAVLVRGHSIVIGNHVSIGAMTAINTRRIEIGDGAVITEKVTIGGQVQTENSAFILGRNTTVMYNSYINTFERVSIGDDSGIGGLCIIFSHGGWSSRFEGYPSTYEPIEIGERVWLPWRVFVMPGAKIGDGSIIGANSLVSGDIPPNCLAAGSPAKVLRENYPILMDDEKKREIFDEMEQKLVGHFRFHGFTVIKEEALMRLTPPGKWRWFRRHKDYTVFFLRSVTEIESLEERLDAGKVDLVLSLITIQESLRNSITESGARWMDIESKERSKNSNDPLSSEVAMEIDRSCHHRFFFPSEKR